jgi:multicomponent Na+:H+ antiporter subunit A
VLALVLAHAVAALALVPVARRLGASAFLPAALLPLITLIWASVTLAGLDDGEAHTQTWTWVAGLDLELAFRVDGLSAVMAIVIGGIGLLVCLYAAWYFAGEGPLVCDSPASRRVAPLLIAFAGSMLGLVLSDNVLLLFLFWELTSITSFLLIGTEDEKPAARAAAQQALLITGAGGLAMFGGLILLGQQTGEWTLSGLITSPGTGTVVDVAVVLVLAGALTKSAQVPFHSWLPGAMSAPTPVSTYLHSATMVKAGIYLVARLSPAYAEVGWWRPIVITAGVASLLVGGVRALRQHDLKLLLAYGTVSQLGLMFLLFGVGTPEAWFAGIVLLLAHAVFKAGLFMIVGIVDHATHTRDIRLLDRLARVMPTVAVAGIVGAASMAGLPPLLGFIAKEEALAALLEPGSPGGWAVLLLVVVGSVFTVAYSARFAIGAFGPATAITENDPGPIDVHPPRPPIVGAPALLAVLSVALGLAPALLQPLVDAATAWWGPEQPDGYLALWHGLEAPLLWSAIVIGGGVVLVVLRQRVERVQAALPRPPGTQRIYDQLVRGLLRGADRLTGVVQNGSLPVYLGVILVIMSVSVGVPLLMAASSPRELVFAESGLQVAVGAIILVLAVAAAVARRRFFAVLLLGAVGYGIAVLFIIQGAPDLAITQLLIETLGIVAFVLVLRHLPIEFPRRPFRSSQLVRAAIAVVVGAVVFVFALTASDNRTEQPVSDAYLERAYPEADGTNVVNVIIVDFRGFDTLGEITVLVIAALGIGALLTAGRRASRGEPPPEPGTDEERAAAREEVRG